MKSFIKKSIFISLPLVVLLIFMEFLLRNIPNDYTYKKSYLDQHASEIETLILGSSHAYYGLNPIYFTNSTFNVSHIAQTLEYDSAIFNKYFSDFKNLKTVIIPISYFSLYSKLENGTESWRVKNYVLYYGFKNFTSINSHSEVLSHRLSSNLGRLQLFNNKNKSEITCSKLGWGAGDNFSKENNLTESGKSGAKNHTVKDLEGKTSKKIYKDNILLLNKIINECKKKDINVILLTLPAYKTYTEHLNEYQLNATIKTAKNLDEVNANVAYLNFLYDSRFDANDFHDGHHLSVKGATKLSQIVNNIIVHP